MKPDDVMERFRTLFARHPEAASGLAGAPDIDAAAELLERIGARHGIATSAAEIRSHVRRLREEMARGELSDAMLDGIAAGQGNELHLIWLCLGRQDALP
ncbi:hypothetical protein NON00_23255 [Roseomonas sp. GC11]|uniref:hypothetical protein n=1 Tax=Roseomonas sp. GC11 TaxID=2950546 RepID=UPI00210E3D8F|nr:hypothetical protein [Roseomonas sp. GC11]MCQ4162825.1 hypothetical protein [Roseomonas sp. GC11]